MRLILLMALGLAACAPSGPVSQLPRLTAETDTCDGLQYTGLIGRDATDLERVLILRQVRVLRPGQPVSRDLRPGRITFDINANGVIGDVRCG